jgi:hypothetical protein
VKAGINLSISVLLSLILGLSLTGCRQNRSLAGLWKGDRDWKSIPADEGAARAMAAIDLDLKPSGEFILKEGGSPFTGIWTQNDSKVELKVETFMNRPIDHMDPEALKRLEFNIRVDKGRLFYQNYIGEKEIELKK